MPLGLDQYTFSGRGCLVQFNVSKAWLRLPIRRLVIEAIPKENKKVCRSPTSNGSVLHSIRRNGRPEGWKWFQLPP